MNMSKKLFCFGAIPLLIAGGGTYLFLSGSLGGDAGPLTQGEMSRYQAGDLEIAIGINPGTARVGKNKLNIEVWDSDGNPVSGIEVNAFAQMPAMGSMAAMRAPADMEEMESGHYEGSVKLSMRGEWPLTVEIKDPARDNKRLQFDLATDRKGLTIAAGGTPIESMPMPTGQMTLSESDGKDSELITQGRYQAGDLEIEINIDPGTARVGDNKLNIAVWDTDGNPVSGIEVDAFAQMPAMGTMAAMRAPADMEEVESGRYEGSVKLSMRGEWPLTVEIKDPARGNKRLQFDLATDRKGLTIAAGGTPAGGMAMPMSDENIITIDSRRRQMIGVKTEEAMYRDLTKPIRAVGAVAFDERLLSQVTLKFDGFIGDLKADYVGAKIVKNQVLFTVYSPELLAAQQEYLETLKRRSNQGAENVFLQAARQRLALWDMSLAEISALEKRGTPKDYVAIHALKGGTLIERNVADGSAAKMGQTLLSIADLSRVWVEADVFEEDLELVRVGMSVTVTLPHLLGRRYQSTVEYVSPYLDEQSRTGHIRLSLANPTGELKPNMYADVTLNAELGQLLSVPEEAIIVAGNSRIVFVDLGGGRLKPVWVKVGRTAQGFIEVTEGLSLGDNVVTSGNFLIAAETRLKTGINQW